MESFGSERAREFAEASDRKQRKLRHLSEWELPESVRDVMGRASRLARNIHEGPTAAARIYALWNEITRSGIEPAVNPLTLPGLAGVGGTWGRSASCTGVKRLPCAKTQPRQAVEVLLSQPLPNEKE